MNHRPEAQLTKKQNKTHKMKNRLNDKVALVTGGNSGISESNLWVMLHRARKQLREHLEK